MRFNYKEKVLPRRNLHRSMPVFAKMLNLTFEEGASLHTSRACGSVATAPVCMGPYDRPFAPMPVVFECPSDRLIPDYEDGSPGHVAG